MSILALQAVYPAGLPRILPQSAPLDYQSRELPNDAIGVCSIAL